MAVDGSFETAKAFYMNEWRKSRLDLIEDLQRIRDDLQEQEKLHSIGLITYSGVSIVGGALTLAGIYTSPSSMEVSERSLKLLIAGIATYLTSRAAMFTHQVVKTGIITKKRITAEQLIQNHDKSSKEMEKLARDLINDLQLSTTSSGDSKINVFEVFKCVRRGLLVCRTINDLIVYTRAARALKQGDTDKANKLLSLSPGLAKKIPENLKEVSNGVTRLSNQTYKAIASIGIFIDVLTIIKNARELMKNPKGSLNKQAQSIGGTVKCYEKELGVYQACFE